MTRAASSPLGRFLAILVALLGLGMAYGPVLGAPLHGHDLELLVRAGRWTAERSGFGPSTMGEFAPIEVLGVVGDDEDGDVGSLLSGLMLIASSRLWGAIDSPALGLPSSFFYRVENLGLLLLAGWGLARFLGRLFRPWVGAEQAGRAAFAAAAIFVVHPLCVPTVASVAGRADLLTLALGCWAAAAFLIGRQERQYLLLVLAGILTLLAGLSGQLALALPPALATAEFLSSGRQRKARARARTALNTFLLFSLFVQLNVALVSTTTGHGYYPRVSYSLAGLLEPGAVVAAMGNVLGKLGVLCLPANAESLGALGVLVALGLFLLALQPALTAARSAPRLWTAAFLWWASATAFALLFGLHKPVDLGTMGDAVSLVPATLVLCAGLGLGSTAVRGFAGPALPLALALGYAGLAHGNAQPWRAAADAFLDLRRDLLAALDDHPDARRVVVLDAPRDVLGVDGIEDGLRWAAHPMFTGAPVLAASQLAPLPIVDLPRDVFATWTRSSAFDAELDGGLLLIYPTEGLAGAEGPLPLRAWRMVARVPGGPARTFWSETSRSPYLGLDSFGPAVVELLAPLDAPEQLPGSLDWRAFGEVPMTGTVPVRWVQGADGSIGYADAGSDLGWRLGGRIARVWFERGLPTLREGRIVEALPRPTLAGPAQVGIGWRFEAPSHPLLEDLGDRGEWVLRVLSLDSLEHRRAAAPVGHAGSPLRFAGVGQWAEARGRDGERVAWELDYVLDGASVLRAAGESGP
jgi:hypothetical protein